MDENPCIKREIEFANNRYLSCREGKMSMAKALVFINTKQGSAGVVKDLEKVHGVSEAHSSRGMYDAVAMVQGETLNKVKEIVSKQIRSMDNVKSTLTLTLIEEPLKASR